MEKLKIFEEKLREAACVGDIDTVAELLTKGIDPNAKHKINGWTPLHWASKRGHVDIVKLLLSNNADKTIVAEKGETPVSLATRPEVRQLLGADPTSPVSEPSLPISPNYIKNPPLSAKVELGYPVNGMNHRKHNGTTDNSHQLPTSSVSPNEELVLKVRVANCGDPDFIEVELPVAELTYYTLLRVCCDELGLTASQVIRIRKMPDTVIRKDKDVQRLRNFQEIELVVSGGGRALSSKTLSSGILFPGSAANNGYQSIHLYKNQTILY